MTLGSNLHIGSCKMTAWGWYKLHRYTVYCTEPSTKCEFYIYQPYMGDIILWAVTRSTQTKPGSVKHRYVTYRGVHSLLCNFPQSLCSFFPSFSSPLSSFLLFTFSSYLFTSHPHSCLSLSIQCLTSSMDGQLFPTHHDTLGIKSMRL